MVDTTVKPFSDYLKPETPDGAPAEGYATSTSVMPGDPSAAGPPLWERFKTNMTAAFHEGTLLGAGIDVLDVWWAEQNRQSSPMQAEAVLESKKWRRKQFEELPASATVPEVMAAFSGAIVGGTATPETFIPAGRFLGPAARSMLGPRLTRAFEQGAVGAGINLVTDPMVQTLNLLSGNQDRFDPLRTLYGTAGGAVIGAGLGALTPEVGRQPRRPGDTEVPDPPSKRKAPTRRPLVEPSFLSAEDMSQVVGALRKDGQIKFGEFAQTHTGQLAVLQRAALKRGITARQDPASTFVEMYMAHPKDLVDLAPDLVRDFDARFVGTLGDKQLRGMLHAIAGVVGKRRVAARELSTEAVVDGVRRKQAEHLADPTPGRSYHELKRPETTADPVALPMPEAPDPGRLYGQIMRIIRQIDPAVVDETRIGGAQWDEFTRTFNGALASTDGKITSPLGPTPFEALLGMLVERPRMFSTRHPTEYRLFQEMLDRIDPGLVRMINKSHGRPKRTVAAEGIDRATGLPHGATPARPQDGIPDDQRTARRLIDETTERPSIQKVVGKLGRDIGLTIRQGRIAGASRYEGGTLRVGNVNDFPEIASGAAAHIVDILRRADGEFLSAFINANRTHLANVSGQVQRVAALTGTFTGEQQALANFIYLYTMAPALVNKRFRSLKIDFEAMMEARHMNLLEGLLDARDSYQTVIFQSSADAMRGRIVDGGRRATRVGRAKVEIAEQGLAATFANWAARFYNAFTDDLNPIRLSVRELARTYLANTGVQLDLKAAADPYKLARLSRGAGQVAHMDLMYGVVPYGKIAPEGPTLSGAVDKALGPSQWSREAEQDFAAYTASLRLLTEWQRYLDGNLPGPPDAEPMGSLLRVVDEMDAKYPQFREAAMEVSAFAKQVWRLKYEAGLINKGMFEAGMKRPFYVPVLRDMSDLGRSALARKTGGTGKQSVFFRFKGSDRDIINPIQALMADVYATRSIVARNDVFKALDGLAQTAGFGGMRIVERLTPDRSELTIGHVIDQQFLANAVSAEDAHIQLQLLGDMADQPATGVMRAGVKSEKGEPIIWLWQNGERHALRLADGRFGEEMFQSLTGMNRTASSLFIDVLSKPAAVLRAGVTLAPDFMAKNLIRDQLAAWVLNDGFVPFRTAMSGFRSEFARDEVARLYNSFGGIMGGANVSSVQKGRVKRDIRALRRRGYLVEKVSSLEGFLSLSEVSETATRLGLFRHEVEVGMRRGLTEREALVEAAYVARDFMDYSRHGARMLHARRIVTFLNAAKQGIDKSARTLIAPLVRHMRGDVLTRQEAEELPKALRAWAKLTALGVFGLMLTALYTDDPEYEEISDHLRATNWMVKFNGTWFAIPKPFDLAVLSNIFERSWERGVKGDPTAWARMREGLGELFMPPFLPPAVVAGVGLRYNVDPVTGRVIVPEWQKGKPPELQFSSYTSELSIRMGKAIGVSPAKLDFVMTSLGGTLGRDFLSYSSRMLDPTRPDIGYDDAILTKAFIRDASRSAVSTAAFWQLMGAANGRLTEGAEAYKAAVDANDEAGAREVLANMTLNDRVWVIMATHLKRGDRMLHPLASAKAALGVMSKVRKQLITGEPVKTADGQSVTLSPGQRRQVDDLLSRMSMVVARNALIAIDEPGWARKVPMDLADDMKSLRLLSPAVADYVEKYLGKGIMTDPVRMRQIWPELRRRILEDGPDAKVGDLLKDYVPGASEEAAAAPASGKKRRRKGSDTGSPVGDFIIDGLDATIDMIKPRPRRHVRTRPKPREAYQLDADMRKLIPEQYRVMDEIERIRRRGSSADFVFHDAELQRAIREAGEPYPRPE